MRRERSAKIVATLGPSSSTLEQIRALFEAGVDVFRLNFSHGTHREHQARFEAIRQVEHETGRPIGILADLQGPKLRLGTFEAGRIELAAGAHLRLDLDPCPGDQSRAPLPHPEIFAALQPGTQLLLDDGKVRLETESCGDGFAETLCRVGGPLSDRKGVNVPNAVLPMSAITEKDRADLAFALDHGADWIAFSFVQRPDDVAEGRKLVGGRAGVMVKLEKPAAIQRLSEIIELADGLMVARGDLGVEMPPEDVPSVQKQVVNACRAAGKPVVVATQMLESMITSPTPTRAEASDVATAVYEGADAVMLSAETAAGRYPIEIGRNDEPHRLPGAAGSALLHDARGDPDRARAYRPGRDQRRRSPSREHSRRRGDRFLHDLGRHGAARRTRAPRSADPGVDLGPRHRPAARRFMGGALRTYQRCQKLQ